MNMCYGLYDLNQSHAHVLPETVCESIHKCAVRVHENSGTLNHKIVHKRSSTNTNCELMPFLCSTPIIRILHNCNSQHSMAMFQTRTHIIWVTCNTMQCILDSVKKFGECVRHDVMLHVTEVFWARTLVSVDHAKSVNAVSVQGKDVGHRCYRVVDNKLHLLCWQHKTNQCPALLPILVNCKGATFIIMNTVSCSMSRNYWMLHRLQAQECCQSSRNLHLYFVTASVIPTLICFLHIWDPAVCPTYIS